MDELLAALADNASQIVTLIAAVSGAVIGFAGGAYVEWTRQRFATRDARRALLSEYLRNLDALLQSRRAGADLLRRLQELETSVGELAESSNEAVEETTSEIGREIDVVAEEWEATKARMDAAHAEYMPLHFQLNLMFPTPMTQVASRALAAISDADKALNTRPHDADMVSTALDRARKRITDVVIMGRSYVGAPGARGARRAARRIAASLDAQDDTP